MKRHLSRWAPAVAAVLVLTACGADNGDSAPVGAPSATDAPSAQGDRVLRAPTPIEVVNGGGAATVSAEDSATADVPTADMRMAQWIAEYALGEGMPALPTNDVGYVFDTSVPVTEAQISAIATALGVSGDVVKIDEGYGVNWRVGPDDGSAPSVWVYEDAQQNWNYNAPWDGLVYDEPCAVSVDSEGNETSDCPEPTAPSGVPSAGEAEQRVNELLAALGIDATGMRFDTFADDWFANVDVSDRTDDRPATRSWHFGFGAEGVLQYASGTLAPVQPVGPYPLVDIDTAVARLGEGFYGGFGRDVAIAEAEVALDSEAAVESVVVVEPEPADSDEPPLPEPAGDEPMPVDPMPPLEPVVVTLVDVQPDLWWAWDADGTVWLLPAYRFIDTDGGWHVAPAVTDEFLIQADQAEVIDPVPVEGDGGIGDGAEPVTPPESLPPVPAEEPGVDPDPVDIEPGGDPEAAIDLLEKLVGLSIDEFTDEALASGFATRIVTEDGESLAVTMDYRTDRVNVAVDGGIVVKVESIG